MNRRSAILSSFVVLLVGCGSEPNASAYSVRDSADVRIVETVLAADTLVAPWRVPPEPAFRVGWDEEGLLFEHIVSGVVLSGGRFAVGDAGSQIIHLLDRSGSVRSALGGQGEGPREFGQLTGMIYVGGDTLLAADGGNGRISLYADDELVEQVRFISWVGRTAFGFAGRVEGGYALSPAAFMGPDEAGPGWHRYPVLRLDRALTRLDTLTFVDSHWHSRPSDDNPMRPVGVVTVAGGEVVHGTTDRPELRWLTDEGLVHQIARWSIPTSDVGEVEWASYEQGYRERYGARYDRADLEGRLAARKEDFSGACDLPGGGKAVRI